MLLLSAFAVGFSSCDALFGEKEPQSLEEMVIEETEFTVPAEGGEIEVTFTPNSSWTALCEERWVDWSPEDGEASERKVTIVVEVDENDGEEREADLVISFETNDVVIEITQLGVEDRQEILLDQTEFDVPAEGDEIEISFVPPTEWEVSCEDDWISLDPWYGNASKREKSFTVTVEENTSVLERTAVVVLAFKEEDGSDVNRQTIDITITQAGAEVSELPDPGQTWYVVRSADDGDTWNSKPMSWQNGLYVLQDCDCEDYEYLQFFEETTQDYYGCSAEYDGGDGKTNARVELVTGEEWWWFQTDFAGRYDIYLDPQQMCVWIMCDGYVPNDMPTTGNVLYDYYDDILDNANEGDWVKVFGVVLAKSNYGFIVAVDSRYYNNVYVYDRGGLCAVDLGYWIDLYAKVQYYHGLPELVVEDGQYWCHTFQDEWYDYQPEEPYLIEDPSDYSSTEYEFVRYVGTLENSGSYYNIVFDGHQSIKGSITSPAQDLSQYVGKRVCVDGYFAGFSESNGVTYLHTILKWIYDAEDGGFESGSTEDLTPGESFPVTRTSNGRFR